MNELQLEVINLTKKFHNHNAIESLSYIFHTGIYGLIGNNGAGKSTFIHMLSLILEPTEGEILYNGIPILKLGKEYRRLIGLMPQNQQGYAEFTGIQFLYYMASLKGMKKEQAEREINELIDVVSLNNSIHKKIKTYSGGMRQRLMFAQAMLNNPKILILDEPTAGLDPFERIKLRNYIRSIAKNRIVIIATHVMQDIEFIAEQILMLKDGKLIQAGSIEELINSVDFFVYEKIISTDSLIDYQRKYKVSKIAKSNKDISIRFISQNKELNHLVVPNLEDIYLHYMVPHEST